jgi:hypothetical protein
MLLPTAARIATPATASAMTITAPELATMWPHMGFIFQHYKKDVIAVLTFTRGTIPFICRGAWTTNRIGSVRVESTGN